MLRVIGRARISPGVPLQFYVLALGNVSCVTVVTVVGCIAYFRLLSSQPLIAPHFWLSVLACGAPKIDY